MAKFQVVAVYPSGRRFEIREPHDSFLAAEHHRAHCELPADHRDEWVYEIDMRYVGSDGQTHWRGDVCGEDLGYSDDEVADVRAMVADMVERRRVV